MTDENSPLKFLEQASQLHGEKVVIEFAIDRFQHFICVKVTLFLALAAKLTEILNGNLSCYGEFDNGKGIKYFNAFASAYCWESPSISEYGENCKTASTNINGLANGSVVTNILRWLPYYLLVKAILFAIPSAYWHYRIGGRLTGHLNFIKLLITEAAEQVKGLPSALPDNSDKIYPETTAELDGFQRFDICRKIWSVKESAEEKYESEINGQFDDAMSACKSPPTATSAGGQTEKDEKFFETTTAVGPGDGKLLDRHLFSMLCYENFAAFHHFLYFKSICKATFFAHRIDKDDRFPLNQGIIKLWCHKDNFCGRFLVIRYYVKHAIAIMLALAALRLSAYILNLSGSDLWRHDSFRCQVLNYEDRDVLCTLHRRSLMLALLVLDLCISIFCLVTSIQQLRYVATNRHRQSSCFFENLDDSGSMAMLAAERKRNEDRKK